MKLDIILNCLKIPLTIQKLMLDAELQKLKKGERKTTVSLGFSLCKLGSVS